MIELKEMQQELLKCKCQLEDVEKKLRWVIISSRIKILFLSYFMKWDLLIIV